MIPVGAVGVDARTAWQAALGVVADDYVKKTALHEAAAGGTPLPEAFDAALASLH